jgi:hypothetical protein
VLYYKNRKGVVVEAMKVGEDTVDAIANWSQSQIVEEKDAISGEASEGLNVKTPTGKKRASRGMYVVKVGQLFYVESASTFERSYSLLNAPLPATEPKKKKPLVTDPFDGMPRFGEGPKP